MTKVYITLAVGTALIAQVVCSMAHITGFGAFTLGLALDLIGLAVIWTIRLGEEDK